MLVSISCVGNVKVPTDIVERDTLAVILSEIHLAEARVSKMNFGSMDSSVVVYNQLQQEIWETHNVDSALYKKSYAFYAAHPELMAELYEIVSKRLQDVDTTTVNKQ